MVFRERLPDGSTKITGGLVGGDPGPPGKDGTRWGTTAAYVATTASNVLVNFTDGDPPRVGDLVVSSHVTLPGAVSRVIAVVDSTHADLQYTGVDLQGPQGPEGPQGDPGVAASIYEVRVATTGVITLSGTQTIDGVALSVDDLVLVRMQGHFFGGGNLYDNGVWQVKSGAWVRASFADTAAKLDKMWVYVREGTSFARSNWKTTFKSTDTLGTTAVYWDMLGRTIVAGIFTSPLQSGVGTTYYDDNRKTLFISRSSGYVPASKAISEGSGTAPGNPINGEFWPDTSSNKMKWYDGSNWKVIGSIGLPSWIVVGSGGTAPAFQNGWVNFDAATYAPARFMLFGGIVFVQGVVKSGTALQTIFTLPAGYRPGRTLLKAEVTSGGAMSSVEINTAGGIRQQVGTNSYQTINFCFPAEQ